MSDTKIRFEKHYTYQSENGCWNWHSSKSAAGYGRFMLNGKAKIASRVAYELYCGPIPEGACVLHSCDNPACVNPSHLRCGNHKENMDDRASRGRSRGGRLGGKPLGKRLTSEEKAEIRRLCSLGKYTDAEIADRFGTSRSTVWSIRNV